MPLRFAGNGDHASAISSLIPEAARGYGGADKFLRIPDVEQFVESMLPRLNIEAVTRYLGNGSFGVIFEVELKPSTGVATASQWQDDSLEAHSPNLLLKSPLMKSGIDGAATLASHQSMPPHKQQMKEVEEDQSLLGDITESKIIRGDRAALKIAGDSIEISDLPSEIKLLVKKLQSLNQKLERSIELESFRMRMRSGVKSSIAGIRKIIAGLGHESPLKLKLSEKSSILDGILEYSEALPDQAKFKQEMTEAEREAATKIMAALALFDLDSLEAVSSSSDEQLALVAIADNLDYILLGLGEKYVIKKKDEQMIELVKSHIDSLSFKFCDNYIKQKELSKSLSQVFGYIDIVKSISGHNLVCFATMELAKADLNEPIKFLEDEYSSVQAGDEMFSEKVKARFGQFAEMLKDLLQGFFDLHLKGGVLHDDIRLDNLLLVEEVGKLRMKINDFDFMKPLPTYIELPEFAQHPSGLDILAAGLRDEAQTLLSIVEELLFLNEDEIGAHTIDDFELRLDNHESIKAPMTVRQLILAHFTYLQDKIISQQASQKLPDSNRRRII